MPQARYFKCRGWFRLIPPKADRIADYYFRDFEDMQNFAAACGWKLCKVGQYVLGGKAE